MNADPSLDAGSALVMIVMGVVIVAPTIVIILAVVLARLRNPKDGP